MVDIYPFLEQHHIVYQRLDHQPVFTCEEARRLVPEFHGAEIKNLFVKDKKGRNHFLIVVGYDKNVDLKKLSSMLEVKSLSLASPQRLMDCLGLEPGSVTVLGVINDPEGRVQVVVDKALWREENWGCHPLVNTSTLVMSRTEIERFLRLTNHPPKIINLPARPPSSPGPSTK